jgi:methylated-DNA-protein-cysteine methyltransferase-like protein
MNRDLFQRVSRAVRRIPEGTVATYGQIAALAGEGIGPRQVGRALARMPESMECPWHRVINARGEIPPRGGSGSVPARQRRMLEAEGILFRGGRVDLEVYRWDPEG